MYKNYKINESKRLEVFQDYGIKAEFCVGLEELLIDKVKYIRCYFKTDTNALIKKAELPKHEVNNLVYLPESYLTAILESELFKESDAKYIKVKKERPRVVLTKKEIGRKYLSLIM